MDRVTRRRWAAAATAGAAALGAVALVATYGGFVVLSALYLPLVLACAAWFLVAVAVVLYAPARRQVLWGAAPVFALAYLTIAGAFMHTVFADEGRVVRTVRTRAHEVRLVADTGFLDPQWQVRVRTRDGLLSRERTVRRVHGPEPVGLVVTGERSVRVTDEAGKTYDVTF